MTIALFKQKSNAPAPGTPAYNPAWYAYTDIYWDPVIGNDSNAGDNSATPVLTFAEIVRRYGSTSPVMNYGQNVTIHLLASQPANQDPVFFEPRISGGGYAALIGTPTQVADIPSGGAVTAKSRGAPGTRLQVASMPGGTAQYMLVQNVTRSSYAFIDSMAAAVATMQQPITATSATTIAIPTAVADDAWATTDHLKTFTLPLCNLKRWSPVGGDISSGASPCVGWVQWVEIADSSAAATSVYFHHNDSCSAVLSLCRVDCRLHASANGGRGNETTSLGSTFLGAIVLASGQFSMQGGAAAAGLTTLSSVCNLNTDVYIHGALDSSSSVLNAGAAFGDGTWTIRTVLSAGGPIWGSYAPRVNPGGTWLNNTGSTFALSALLTSGAIKLGTATTGSTAPTAVANFTANGTTQVDVAGTFPANAPIWLSLKTIGGTPVGLPYFSQAQAANAFHVKAAAADTSVYNWQAGVVDGISLTPGNIDTYGGLSNPATGARYCNVI